MICLSLSRDINIDPKYIIKTLNALAQSRGREIRESRRPPLFVLGFAVGFVQEPLSRLGDSMGMNERRSNSRELEMTTFFEVDVLPILYVDVCPPIFWNPG